MSQRNTTCIFYNKTGKVTYEYTPGQHPLLDLSFDVGEFLQKQLVQPGGLFWEYDGSPLYIKSDNLHMDVLLIYEELDVKKYLSKIYIREVLQAIANKPYWYKFAPPAPNYPWLKQIEATAQEYVEKYEKFGEYEAAFYCVANQKEDFGFFFIKDTEKIYQFLFEEYFGASAYEYLDVAIYDKTARQVVCIFQPFLEFQPWRSRRLG